MYLQTHIFASCELPLNVTDGETAKLGIGSWVDIRGAEVGPAPSTVLLGPSQTTSRTQAIGLEINVSLKQRYDVLHRISKALRVPGVPAPPIGLVAAAYQLCNNDEIATMNFLKQQWGAVVARDLLRRRRKKSSAKRLQFPKPDNPPAAS
ncbi:unnamed protein product [Bemisia tabaci]|uniref:Uncharacterized protein n=1 Tax=Bemisia tabaci TaxID=7038 RepID=A0A9P0ADH2_BEMTA|nr:unnamed protein product [Bemisia tabaci]